MHQKKITYVLCLSALTVVLSYSQTKEDTPTATRSKLEQKREGTQKLDFLVGEWKTETWFYGDGKRPDKPEKGTYSAYWTLNNTFITDDILAFHNGETYLGKGYHSYNPDTQRYETWYFDSDGMVVRYPNGKWVDENTLVFKGKDVHPSGIVEKHTYFQIISPDAFELVEKQDYGDGNGFVTVLEVKYKRLRE